MRPVIQAPLTQLGCTPTSPDVVAAAQDDPDAKPLVLSSASIDFSHVTHEYTAGTPVLRDVSFSVPGGTTTALVCGGNGAVNYPAMHALITICALLVSRSFMAHATVATFSQRQHPGGAEL